MKNGKLNYLECVQCLDYCLTKGISQFSDAFTSDCIYPLAYKVAYKTLNKIYSASGEQYVKELADSLAVSRSILDCSKMGDTVSPAYELVNGAYVAIMDYYRVALEKGLNSMSDAYTHKVQSKQIVVGLYTPITADDVMKDESTTPMKEVFRMVRRQIDGSGSIQTACNGYTYLEDIVTTDNDNESDAIGLTIYRRAKKYADIGGNVSGGYNNEKANVYTACENDVDTIGAILENLKLSAREKEVINLRLCGYGYKAIAKKMGIAQGNVQTMIKRIRAKAEKIGFTADALKNEMTA